jgi:hypothetical protein
MKNAISAVAVIAALSLAMPVSAWAQETIGSQTGQPVDGQGGGGQEANKLVPDGFPNSDILLLIPKTPARINAACDVRVEFRPAWCSDFDRAPRTLHPATQSQTEAAPAPMTSSGSGY